MRTHQQQRDKDTATRSVRRSLYDTVTSWRASDQHTGIRKDKGLVSTYEHIDGATEEHHAPLYRIETVIMFSPPTPTHRNVHYVPGRSLDTFFNGWDQHAEQIVDIRPVTKEKALEELRAFRAWAENRVAQSGGTEPTQIEAEA